MEKQHWLLRKQLGVTARLFFIIVERFNDGYQGILVYIKVRNQQSGSYDQRAYTLDPMS